MKFCHVCNTVVDQTVLDNRCIPCAQCLTCGKLSKNASGYCDDCRAGQFKMATICQECKRPAELIYDQKCIPCTQAIIQSLRSRQSLLIQEISQIHNQLDQINAAIQKENHKVSTQEWPCTCGERFPSFLERLSHISQHSNTQHQANGEYLDGRHVFRNESIKGEPVVRPKGKCIDTTEMFG